jgi:hypothetical protein
VIETIGYHPQASFRAASDPNMHEKLRVFIFEPTPQPYENPVFEQYITGVVVRQQQPSLTIKAEQTFRLKARVMEVL